MSEPRRILVTSALPYANGPLHLGHMLEAIQTDVWARFQRLRGHECYYVCADDTHGTPIMLKAQAEGIAPETLIGNINREHRRDLADMRIALDNFGSTHAPENAALCARMYLALRARRYIDRRVISQAYDEKAQMFLPDRYVKGNCPNCNSPDQYGDSCEVCGTTYTPADLTHAVSVVSGTAPVWRDSEHYFFRLSEFESRLAAWIGSGAVQEAVAHKLTEWFSQGLRDWDISRDAPYFGFEIPDAPGKYFYVWFDAPIGYLASFTELCARNGLDFEDFFGAQSRAELHHFIGKDILYFHTLFWPAVLEGAGFRRPTSVHAHGFLTINGQKMSKSRGTFITARRYLEQFDAQWLRYYFAAKLGPGIDDLDLNLEEFTTRLNSEVVGKLVNIASRCASFIARSSDGRLAAALPDPALYRLFADAQASIASAYESRDTAGAVREIMALADRANQFIDFHKPWAMAKQPEQAQNVQRICTQGLNLFRTLMVYLEPVLPDMAQQARAFFNEPSWRWESAGEPLLDSPILPYRPLATRLDLAAVKRLIEVPSSPEATAAPPAPPAAPPAAPPSSAGAPALISVEEFLRIDLRVARVISAEAVAGADKLLKLRLDVGSLGERDIFAGIRAAYVPESLVGRLVVVVANLAPRKMRFGISEGMMLAAGPGGSDVFALSADSGAVPGMRIK